MARYGKKAQQKVRETMRERKRGPEVRPLRPSREEPQAGDGNRALEGSARGREGAEEARELVAPPPVVATLARGAPQRPGGIEDVPRRH